ncbi:MAG: hypothetical protein II401_01630 [Bacteroidales bacterium]|nr:hypothetical protein [Bacteroidales bacterium]
MKKVIYTMIWNNKDFSTPLRCARNDKEHLSFRLEPIGGMEKSPFNNAVISTEAK